MYFLDFWKLGSPWSRCLGRAGSSQTAVFLTVISHGRRCKAVLLGLSYKNANPVYESSTFRIWPFPKAHLLIPSSSGRLIDKLGLGGTIHKYWACFPEIWRLHPSLWHLPASAVTYCRDRWGRVRPYQGLCYCCFQLRLAEASLRVLEIILSTLGGCAHSIITVTLWDKYYCFLLQMLKQMERYHYLRSHSQ